MTPMTGRVADAQKDRLVLSPRFSQSLFAPRIPVHGVVCVLQEIRAGLVLQTISVLVLDHADCPFSLLVPILTRAIEDSARRGRENIFLRLATLTCSAILAALNGDSFFLSWSLNGTREFRDGCGVRRRGAGEPERRAAFGAIGDRAQRSGRVGQA